MSYYVVQVTFLNNRTTTHTVEAVSVNAAEQVVSDHYEGIASVWSIEARPA